MKLTTVYLMIVMHPMTQILEEEKTRTAVNKAIGIQENIQFLLMVGYIENYPGQVTLVTANDHFAFRKVIGRIVLVHS